MKYLVLFVISMMMVGCIPKQEEEQGTFIPTHPDLYGYWKSDSDYQVRNFGSGARVHFIFMLSDKKTSSCYQGVKSKKCFCENTNTDISNCFQKENSTKLTYVCSHFGDMAFTKLTDWPAECTLKE